MDTHTSYRNTFMQSLQRLRGNGTTDLTLKFHDRSIIHCHKLVLMAASPFFETMLLSGLKESSQREIELDFPSPKVAKMIIDYFYSGKIDINSENVQDLITASEFLCLADLKEHLGTFMTDQVDSTNCIEFYKFARHYRLAKLVPHCLEYVLSHFKEAFNSPKCFDELSEDELIAVLSDDRLSTKNEDNVFHSVVRWVNADLAKRKEAFVRIAHFIRFPFCTQECLIQMTREALMINPTCMEFLHEGLDFNASKCHSNRIDLHSIYNTSIVQRHAYDSIKPYLIRIQIEETDPGIYCIFGVATKSLDEDRQNWIQCFQSPLKNAHVNWFFSPAGIHWIEANDDCPVNDGRQQQVYHHPGNQHQGHGGWPSQVFLPRGWIGGAVGPHNVFTSQQAAIRRSALQSSAGQGTQHCWDIETHTITTSRWSEPKKSEYSLTYIRGKIFALGGVINSFSSANVESFDKKRNQWNKEPAMLRAVNQPYIVHFQSKVYALGGVGANGPTQFTQEFDPESGKWEMKKEMPDVCQSGAAVSLNDNIFVVGGKERACFRYTPTTDTWTVLAQPTHVHSVFTGATAWKGNILLFGKDHEEQYIVNFDQWSSCYALRSTNVQQKFRMGLCTLQTKGLNIK